MQRIPRLRLGSTADVCGAGSLILDVRRDAYGYQPEIRKAVFVGIVLLRVDSDSLLGLVRNQIPRVHGEDILLGIRVLLARFPGRRVASAPVSFSVAVVLCGAWFSGLV